MQDDQSIEQIQSKVDAQRAIVSALDAKITDSALKLHLQQAAHWLHDVENVFLRSAREEKRTPEALTRWLSYAAEAPLQWAMNRRKHVEDIVAKYGPNATLGGR
jgi:hypothetical protein